MVHLCLFLMPHMQQILCWPPFDVKVDQHCKTRFLQAGGQWLVIDRNVEEDRFPRFPISPFGDFCASGASLSLFGGAACETVCHSQSDITPARKPSSNCVSPPLSPFDKSSRLPMFQLFNCSIAQPFVRRSGETNCHPRGICSLISRIQDVGHSSFPAFWNCLKRRVRMFSKVCLRVWVAINRNRLPPARHRLHLELSETVIQMSPLHWDMSFVSSNGVY